MQIRNYLQSLLCLALLAGSMPAMAATVSYLLDYSNALTDQVEYLSVTISDDTAGQLDFWVEALSALDDVSGDNYGIQSFAFNYSELFSPQVQDNGTGNRQNRGQGRGLRAAGRSSRANGAASQPAARGRSQSGNLSGSNFILPDGWRVQYSKGMSEAGQFDVRILGRGRTREDSLHFSVIGLSLDDVLAGFAAHVAGFDLTLGDCSLDGGACSPDITSAFFFGDTLVPPTAVPLPAAAWLFLTGLLGLIGIARRREVNETI